MIGRTVAAIVVAPTLVRNVRLFGFKGEVFYMRNEKRATDYTDVIRIYFRVIRG